MLNYLKYLAFAIVISFTMFGCTDHEDHLYSGAAGEGEGGGEDVVDPDEPVVPETFVISGQGGNGGAGGALLIRSIGQVNILKAGVVDTAFTSNYAFTPDYGLQKSLVNRDYTVPNEPNLANLTKGDLFTKRYDSTLYMVTTTAGIERPEAVPVSGIEVAEGVTLSIETNQCDKVDLDFSDDVVIKGTVKPVWQKQEASIMSRKPNPPDMPDMPDTPKLAISTDGHIQTGAASLITVAGTDETLKDNKAAAAKNAGDIELDAFEGMLLAGTIDASGGDSVGGQAAGGGSIDIDSFGTIVNSGPMTVKNGDGATIHDCGGIEISSEYHVFNTGDLDARGGTAADGVGGQPSRVEIVATGGSLFNAGDILASAGAGRFGGGSLMYGDFGRELDVESRDSKSRATVSLKAANNLTNSGDIEASGGSATFQGPGGHAGTIELVSQAGDVKSSGSLTANGGNAKEPEVVPAVADAKNGGCGNYYGGFGGKIRVKVSGHNYESVYYMLPQLSMNFGSVALSGDLNVNGGMSGLCNNVPMDSCCGMYYGRGGKIEIGNYMRSCFGPALNVNLLGYENIDLAGGASNKVGGPGGILMINVPFDVMFAGNEMMGVAGKQRHALRDLQLIGTGIVNQALLNLAGGNGAYRGGSGGKVLAIAEGPITNAADADLAAGNGLVGGNGHDPLNRSILVLMSGTLTTNSGDLVLKGGDVAAESQAAVNAMVGGGGFVGLFSQKGGTVNTGDINVAPGAGVELSDEAFKERVGFILIDCFDETPADGVLAL